MFIVYNSSNIPPKCYLTICLCLDSPLCPPNCMFVNKYHYRVFLILSFVDFLVHRSRIPLNPMWYEFRLTLIRRMSCFSECTRGAYKFLARPGRKNANVPVRIAWISFGALPCRKKKTWWQLASRCCWNRARPWHASELISFLVGLRTYQHPGYPPQ